MKTLKEQAGEILAAKASKAAKKAALLKLGITNEEVFYMLESLEPVKGTFTFGVEIECGVSRSALMAQASATGMALEYQGYNHRDGHDFYKFVTDCSLSIGDAIECVSPVLKGKAGEKNLKTAIKTLNAAGAQVNSTCGLHVHIGAGGLSGVQYSNVFANYYYLENLIDSFMAPSRRGNNNTYCRTLQHCSLDECGSVQDVQLALHHNRYHKVNAQAYNAHKTIEFRQHQGTVSAAKIINWIQFCGKLVLWSKTHRLTAPISSIEDVPFLTPQEKDFFKGRQQEFSGRE